VAAAGHAKGAAAAGASGARGAIAATCPLAIVLFVSVAAAGLAGDLLSKHYAFARGLGEAELPDRVERIIAQHDPPPPPEKVLEMLQIHWPLIPGVQITLSTNPGAVFGLAVPRWLMATATVAITVLVAYFFGTSPRRAWSMHVALACILAGALGNFYDRIFGQVQLPHLPPIRGHVRDFIDCSALYYPWVFNIADMLLVVGVMLLLVHWLIAARRHRDRAAV